jgi:hypothetical protein
MTTVRGMVDGFPGGNRRSYISTDYFDGKFYSYKTTRVQGVLTSVLERVTDNRDLCPPGRILRENGRKLHAGANPNVNQYMVGVYDAVSFLNGFIDPNTVTFSIFNTDKPYFIDNDDQSMGSDGASDVDPADLGNPVYTQGNILAIAVNDGDYSLNSVGMINSTIQNYNRYGKFYFNYTSDPETGQRDGEPACEVGDNSGNGAPNYAGLYVTNVSSSGVFAESAFPYVDLVGFAAPRINWVVPGEPPTGYFYSGIPANTDGDGTVNLSTSFLGLFSQDPRLNITNNPAGGFGPLQIGSGLSFFYQNYSTPVLLVSGGPQLDPGVIDSPYIEATSFSSSGRAGLDGNLGNVYASGMLNVPNATGEIQLTGGNHTTGSNTIFTYNPYVFLTYSTAGGNRGSLAYSVNAGAGTLSVNSGNGSDGNRVIWMAVLNGPLPTP